MSRLMFMGLGRVTAKHGETVEIGASPTDRTVVAKRVVFPSKVPIAAVEVRARRRGYEDTVAGMWGPPIEGGPASWLILETLELRADEEIFVKVVNLGPDGTVVTGGVVCSCIEADEAIG